MNFWAELAARSPSLHKLDLCGRHYEEASMKAENAFEELLRLNPASVTTLRRYAIFLDEVGWRPL